MRKIISKPLWLIAFLLIAEGALASRALAVCSQHGTVSTSSVQIVTANEVKGVTEGRHYMMVQNSGTAGMYVAIGSLNVATTSDTYLGPGAAWVLTMQGGAMVPGGDVAAISTGGGSTYSYCDY
jgi:hypothetical protein